VAAFEDGSTRGSAMHAFGELAGAGLVKLKPAAAVWPLIICSRLLLHQTSARVRRDIPAGIFRDGQPIPIQIDDGDDRRGARSRGRRATGMFVPDAGAVSEWAGGK